nr:Rz1 family lipoprotein [Providencia thailandensis]
MQPPPDLLTPLSEIIGYSETELQSQSRWLRGCKTTLERSVYSELRGRFFTCRKKRGATYSRWHFVEWHYRQDDIY